MRESEAVSLRARRHWRQLPGCGGADLGRGRVVIRAFDEHECVAWPLLALFHDHYLGDVVLRRILSTNNHEHGLLHVASALATAILALCVISWLTDKKTESSFVNHLARAGRMSLSIYVIHVLVFNFFVNWMHWIRPTGLDTALLFSVGFYAVIIPAAAWWNKRCGAGPLERMYRMFGG